MLGAAETPAAGRLVEPSRRQTLAGSSGTAVAIVVGQAAAGLSFLVLARRLSPDDFGTYAVLYTAGLTLGGVLDFGSSQFRTRELARGAGLDSFSSWLWHRAAWQSLPVLAVIGVAYLSLGSGTSLIVTVGLVSQGLTYPIASGWSGAVRALRSPALGTWLIAVGNGVLLAAVVLAPDRLLVEVAAIVATLSWLVTAVTSWSATRLDFGSARSRWVGNPWAGGSGFGLFGLAIALQGLQVVIVGAVAGAADAGELAAVSKWVQPVYLVSAAFSTQVFPSMVAATSDTVARRILRPVWIVCALGVVVALGIVVAAPWLVNAILGDDYQNSVVLLQVLAIAAVPVLVNQPLATFLQARGSERSVAVLMMWVVAGLLVGTAAVATFLGAMAAPLCSGLSQCLLMVGLALTGRSHGFRLSFRRMYA